MPALIGMPRAAWRRQPTGRVKVDWKNPLTKNPVFIALLGAPWPVIYSSGIGTYPTNPDAPLRTGTPSVSSSGYGAINDGGVRPISFFRQSSTFESYIGVPIATDFTLGLSLDPSSLSGNNPGFIRSLSFIIVQGSTNKLWVRYNGTDFISSKILSFENTIHLSASFKSGSRVSSVVNGDVFIDSSTTTTTPDMLGTNGFSSIGNNITGEQVNGNYLIFYMFNRYLEVNELTSISENPWQLFAPAPSRFYLIPSSGGGTYNFITALSSSSTTAIAALHLLRAYITAIDSLSSTNSINLTTTNLVALISGLTSASTTSIGSLTVLRTLQSAMASLGTTNPAALAIGRALISALTATSLTHDNSIVAIQRAFLTALAGESSTNSITLVISDLVTKVGPVSDVSAGTWQPSTGIDLYAMVDETLADDADYIYTHATTDTCELRLSGINDPAANTGHVLRYRGSGTFTIRLMQGAVEIASWTETLGETLTTVERSLNSTQADSITDYTDLRIVIET